MFLSVLSFTEFLAILQYAFEKMLTITANTIELLMTNNIVKYCIFLAIAYFIIFVFLEIRDFIPNVLLRRRLENRDIEFQGVTDTTSMSYIDKDTGMVNRRVITKGRRQSRRAK